MSTLDPKAELLLVQRCAEGDRSAWEAFVDGYGPLIRALAQRLLRRYQERPQPTDVDEVCGEVFLALLRHEGRLLRRYNPTWRLSTYLGVICRTAALRQLKRRGRLPAELDAQARPPMSLSHHPDPAGSLLAEERLHALERLREGLRLLSERDRLLLTLRFLDGREYRDIAAVLDVHPESVGQLLTRAKARLARALPDLKEANP